MPLIDGFVLVVDFTGGELLCVSAYLVNRYCMGVCWRVKGVYGVFLSGYK